jgi:hypothetical protein
MHGLARILRMDEQTVAKEFDMSLMRRGFLWCLGLVGMADASAATLTWPNLSGVGACTGTLQACINSAAAGDTVVIGPDELVSPDRYTLIDETITITRSLNLAGGFGIDAVFAEGRRIIVSLNTVVPHNVAISDLTLRRGNVFVQNNGGASGTTISVQRVRVNALPDSASIGCGIEVQNFGGAVDPLVNIGDNLLRASNASADTGSGICVSADASVAQARTNVFRNRIVSGPGAILTGIAIPHDGAGTTNVSANTILGPRLFTGIRVQRAATGPTRAMRVDNNVVIGQDDFAGFGILIQGSDADVRVANNTVSRGQRGIQVTRFSQLGALSGRIANNIVTEHSDTGYAIEAAAGVSVSNLENLTFNNAADLWLAGPGTVTADPQFFSTAHPVLLPTSPAINAGDAAEIPSGVLFDAGGEPRVALGQVDMGAYERSADQAGVLIANMDNTFFNEAFIDHLPHALTAADRFAVTPLRTEPTTVGAQQNLGVYQNPGSPSGWSVFHQDINASIALSQRFSVLAPVAGKPNFTQTTSAGNVSGNTSQLDHPELNGRPFAIALVAHFWQGSYHDFPIGLQYSNAGGGRWFLRNENAATAMPLGQTFHVVVAPLLSPNAMRAVVGSSAAMEWPLEHPMLTDTPCAAPSVGRADNPDTTATVANTTPYTVGYRAPSGPGAPGRWFVIAEAGALPANAAFHLIVDGQQVNRCRANSSALNDALFRNGFE